MITKKQAEQIKKQLLEQIDKSDIPNKEELKSSIESMSPQELEEFLKKNKLIKSQGECIFCSIIDNKIPSYKLAENKEAIAVLEINPISKGHTLIIPKTHSDKASKNSYDLAEEMALIISKAFTLSRVDIIPSILFDHEIINVLPVYKDESLNSKRKKHSEKELEEIQNQMLKVKEEKHQEKPKEKKIHVFTDKDTWLPKRIP